MVKKIVGKITSWSYSRWATYKQCPQKAKFKYIDKLPDPSGLAAERGEDIHKQLEDYVNGSRKSLSAEVQRHLQVLKKLRALFSKKVVHLEQQWAFTDKWEETGWFAPNCWVRIKMDVCVDEGLVVRGIDHKTGKFRPKEYNDQMRLYCIAMLLKFPQAQEAHIELMFHDVEAPPVKLFLKRAFLSTAIERMNTMVEPMLNDTRFAPTKNGLCGWCNFSKTKGGPCKVA